MPAEKTKKSTKATKKSKPSASAEKATIAESDQEQEIVAYEGDDAEDEPNIDLTVISDSVLQEQVNKNDLELKANQMHLAPERKELMDQYLAAIKERDRLENLISPFQDDHERKRVSQTLGKHSTVNTLPIGYMPKNGLRGNMSLEDIHKKMKKDIINNIVAKVGVSIEAHINKMSLNLKSYIDERTKHLARSVTDAVSSVNAGTTLNVFKTVKQKPTLHYSDLAMFWTKYVEAVYEKILAPDGIHNATIKICSNPNCEINDGVISIDEIQQHHSENTLPRTCYRCLGFFCHKECYNICRNIHDRQIGEDLYCTPNSKIDVLQFIDFDKILKIIH